MEAGIKRKVSYSALVLAKIFCMCPWCDVGKSRANRMKFNRVFAVLYAVTLIAMNLWCMRIGLDRSREHHNIIEKFLVILGSTITITLALYLIIGSNFLKHEKWEIFLTNLRSVPDIFEDGIDRQMKRLCWKRTILGHLTFALVLGFYSFYTNFNIGLIFIIQFSAEVIDEYYCFLTSLIACNFASIIQNRYAALQKSLNKLVEDFTAQAQSEEKLAREFLKVGNCYRLLHDLVSNYNNIFGWTMVLIFAHAIVQLLRLVNLVLIIKSKFDITWDITLSILSLAIVSLGESAYIILSCESASAAGRKLERICHKLQEDFDTNSKAREELFKLAEVARSYTPHFTAANFFVINKGTILGIINIATTYLIVIIQFNGTLKEKVPVHKSPN